MDYLHVQGVTFIQYLQNSCKNCDDGMQLITALGDPGRVLILYFPLVFFSMPSVGIKLVWTAAIAEWSNAVLKWLLHGERPYWWVHETNLYKKAPMLQQYSLTCETGPGSPSGHAMVTSAVWFIILNALIEHKIKATNSRVAVWLVWVFYSVFLVAVGISRCYIAAHFPHQIIGGTIAGVLIGMACDHLPTSDFTLRHYIVSSVALLLSGLCVYMALDVLGYDPLWSISKALKWCIRKDWIHLNTTLFAALVIDSASVLGLGLALYYVDYAKDSETEEYSRMFQILSILLSWALSLGSGFLPLPQEPVLLFYSLFYIKKAILPYLIVGHIPQISCLVLSLIGMNGKYKKR